MINSRHYLDYCSTCKSKMVRCADCGNNCCNGTEKCSSCSEAYAHQKIYDENPQEISFVAEKIIE